MSVYCNREKCDVPFIFSDELLVASCYEIRELLDNKVSNDVFRFFNVCHNFIHWINVWWISNAKAVLRLVMQLT